MGRTMQDPTINPAPGDNLSGDDSFKMASAIIVTTTPSTTPAAMVRPRTLAGSSR
jgi:hypothetical protein